MATVYIVTCLTTLTKADKDQLLLLDCITIKDLIQNPDFLKTIELSHNRTINVLKEANQLTN